MSTQPEQEPVAWAHYSTFDNLNALVKSRFAATLSKKETDACCIPLYAKPPQEERNFCPRCGKRLFDGSIHTCTPPQRKPLTEEQIEEIANKVADEPIKVKVIIPNFRVRLARAIEAAHNIKE